MDKIKNLKEKFNNPGLFDQALTHRSWINEHPGKRGSNERLEFLGDAILEYLVSEKLYQLFPKKEEGFLTALRANLVNTTNLSQVANSLGLGQALYLSKGEEEGGGRKNPSLLADTFEALVGAVYLDQGLTATDGFVEENLLANLADRLKKPLKDAKSRLQESVQAASLPAPRYEIVSQSGPDHKREFIVSVTVNGQSMAKGFGRSKAEAEQEAAKEALKKY